MKGKNKKKTFWMRPTSGVKTIINSLTVNNSESVQI